MKPPSLRPLGSPRGDEPLLLQKPRCPSCSQWSRGGSLIQVVLGVPSLESLTDQRPLARSHSVVDKDSKGSQGGHGLLHAKLSVCVCECVRVCMCVCVHKHMHISTNIHLHPLVGELQLASLTHLPIIPSSRTLIGSQGPRYHVLWLSLPDRPSFPSAPHCSQPSSLALFSFLIFCIDA